MIRTLQVIRRFVFEEWGGTETVVWNTAQELARLNNDVEILATSALSKSGYEMEKGIGIHRFSYLYPYLNLNKRKRQVLDKKGGDPYSLNLYKYLLKAEGIDLIHCHTMNRIAASVRLAARQRKIPYVVSFHGGHFDVPASEMAQMILPYKGTFNYGRLLDILIKKRRYLDDADGIICVGYNEYELTRKKYPEKMVYYLPNGVDLDKFSKVENNDFREKYGISREEKVILCVSRIDYQKNQLLLVKLVQRLRREGERIRLVLVGPETSELYAAEIRQAVKTCGLEKEVLLIKGLLASDPDLVKAYQAADIFILPSVHEPFGIVVLEAWASGLPVIAAATGGLKKLVQPEVNGLLFDSSLEDLYDKYRLLTTDNDLASAIQSAAGSEVKRDYTWTAITQKLLGYYQEIRENYGEQR